MLINLGHTVIFVDSMKNQNNWCPLDAAHIIVKDEKQIPDADFIIATGYNSVEPTVKAPSRCGIKLHWIRGWETWKFSEQDIIEKVLKQPTIKIVNSMCLQNKLKSYGFDSEIIYPGYDLEEIYPLNIRDKTKYIVVGGLYLKGDRGTRKRTEWILETGKRLKQKYSNVKLYLFGVEENPVVSFVDKYLKSPDIIDKNRLYNICHIWLSPTNLEGLHIPPAEAMLTECCVVGTNAEMSGMQDYLINGETGLVSENNLENFYENVERLYNDNELRLHLGKQSRLYLLDKIGSRKASMEKFLYTLDNIKMKIYEESI